MTLPPMWVGGDVKIGKQGVVEMNPHQTEAGMRRNSKGSLHSDGAMPGIHAPNSMTATPEAAARSRV